MHDTSRALHSTTTALHPGARYASRAATESLHRRLLRRVAATWRPGLALDVRLSHVHGGTGVGAHDVRTRGVHVRARVRDSRATGVAQLGVGRVGRLVLALRLRALLLLLGWLAHLQHGPLSHQLSVVLLVSSCLGHSLLLLRSVRLLLLLLLLMWLLLRDLLLRSLLVVLGPLVRSSSIAIGAVGHRSIVLIRSLVVVVHRRTVCSGLLLGSANTGSGVHRILTHLTRRLGLMLQLFSGKVRELCLGHLRVARSQLIFDLYDRRHVARRQLLWKASRCRRWRHAGRGRHLLLIVCMCSLNMRCSIRRLVMALLLALLLLLLGLLLLGLLGLLRLLSLCRLLLILSLESGKKGLVTCKLLRCSNAINPRTGHVTVGHRILLAWILCRPVLILVVGMRHTLHIRSLGRTLVLSHMGLRNTLRIHLRHSEVAIAYRHGWLRSLLIRHLPVDSWWMLAGNLCTWLLRSLRPLLYRHSIWNALLRAKHLGVSLLLSLQHLLATLAIDFSHLKVSLVSGLAEFLRCGHWPTRLRRLVLLRRLALSCSTL